MAYCPLRPYMECPLSIKSENLDEAETKERQARFSFIRFLHASPNTQALDIYIDDKKAVSNLPYASMAGYAALPSTNHKFEVYPLGQKGKPLTQFTLNLGPDSYHTIVLAGLSPNIQYRIYRDNVEMIPTNESNLRFVHLSPSAPAVDVGQETGDALFSGITFGRTQDYIKLEPRIYSLRVRASGTPNVVLGLPDINLEGGKAYTIYAIGMLGGSPPLTAIILADGKR